MVVETLRRGVTVLSAEIFEAIFMLNPDGVDIVQK